MRRILRAAVASVLVSTANAAFLPESTIHPAIVDQERPQPSTIEVQLQVDKRAATFYTQTPPKTLTITVAPDNTCGYLSDSDSVPITCGAAYSCSWEAEHFKQVFCVLTGMRYRCLDRETAIDTKLCDKNCRTDPFLWLCVDPAVPYCHTYMYPGGLEAYACVSWPASTKAVFTRSGVARALVTTTLTDWNTFRTLTPSADFTSSTDASSTDTSSATSSTNGPASTTADLPTTSTSQGQGNPDGDKKELNIGAIVGGAVGGFAAVALLVLGVIFLLRRRPNSSEDVADPSPNIPKDQQADSNPVNELSSNTVAYPELYSNLPAGHVGYSFQEQPLNELPSHTMAQQRDWYELSGGSQGR